jgi:hypothetical protein
MTQTTERVTTNSFIPNHGLFEKLAVAQVVRKFPNLYEIVNIITALTRAG